MVVAERYGVAKSTLSAACKLRGVKPARGGARKVERIERLELELASRPTEFAYDAACKALHHWRSEAKRLAELLGVEPRQMDRN